MIAAIYARKPTEQNGVGDEEKSVTRHDDRAADRGMAGMNATVRQGGLTMKTLNLLLIGIVLNSLLLAGCLTTDSGVSVTADGGRVATPSTAVKVLIAQRPAAELDPAHRVVPIGLVDRLSAQALDMAHNLVQTGIATWLEKRGVTVLTVARNIILDEQQFRLIHTGDVPALRVGQLYGADVIVRYFVTGEANQVTVEAVHVQTGVILWSGSAVREDITYVEYNPSGPRLNVNPVVLRALTCHALAAAWGLEQPGNYDAIHDDAC